MKLISVCAAIIFLLLFTGCYYDKEEMLYPASTIDCSTISARYADVAPIISQKCAGAGCHDATSAAGGTVLVTYDQVRAKSDRINQRVIVEKNMPPGTALTAAETATIKCWLGSGMPNN